MLLVVATPRHSSDAVDADTRTEADAGIVRLKVSEAERTLAFENPWTFTAGTAERIPTDGEGTPIELPHRWDLEAADSLDHGTHETTVAVDETWTVPGAHVVLGLDPCRSPTTELVNGYPVEVMAPVREIVVVEVNGKAAGVLWDVPFQLDIADAFHAGDTASGSSNRTSTMPWMG